MLIYVLGVLGKNEHEDTLRRSARRSGGVCFSRPQLPDLSRSTLSLDGLKSDLWLNALPRTSDTFRVRGVQVQRRLTNGNYCIWGCRPYDQRAVASGGHPGWLSRMSEGDTFHAFARPRVCSLLPLTAKSA